MLSLIVPIYKNEANLKSLLIALAEIGHNCSSRLEVVFVVDASPDHCYDRLLACLGSCPFASRLLVLSRNFGAFAAIRAGLLAGRGTVFAVMAADLQEPPELVVDMEAILRQGDVDVVVAERVGRQDPFISRLLSRIFWGMYRRFILRDLPPGGVDIFACNKVFRDHLLKLGEGHSSLVAQIFWLGFRRRTIPYVRRARQEGVSAWTLQKKIHYLMDSVFSFTNLPIRALSWAGGLGAMTSATLAFVVAICRLLNMIEVPGYTAIIIAISFFGALNLLGLGIVGSYAWRTYENTKARPLHIVMHQVDFSGETANS